MSQVQHTEMDVHAVNLQKRKCPRNRLGKLWNYLSPQFSRIRSVHVRSVSFSSTVSRTGDGDPDPLLVEET